MLDILYICFQNLMMRKQSAAVTKDTFPYFLANYFLHSLQNPSEFTNLSLTWARKGIKKQGTRETYNR